MPDSVMLTASALLARLGGQVTLTHEEIVAVAASYAGIRIAADLKQEKLVLTLRTKFDEVK